MLHLDPKMLDRLAEIETDLLSQRDRAEAEGWLAGWLGEIEAIELTLAFLRDKRAEADRLQQREPVALSMPARRIGEELRPR